MNQIIRVTWLLMISVLYSICVTASDKSLSKKNAILKLSIRCLFFFAYTYSAMTVGGQLLARFVKWPMIHRSMMVEGFWEVSVFGILSFVGRKKLDDKEKILWHCIREMLQWILLVWVYVLSVSATRLYLGISPIQIGIIEAVGSTIVAVLYVNKRTGKRNCGVQGIAILSLISLFCTQLGDAIFFGDTNSLNIRLVLLNTLVVMLVGGIIVCFTGSWNFTVGVLPVFYGLWTMIQTLTFQARRFVLTPFDFRQPLITLRTVLWYLPKDKTYLKTASWKYLLFSLVVILLAITIPSTKILFKKKAGFVIRVGMGAGLLLLLFVIPWMKLTGSERSGGSYQLATDVYNTYGFTLSFLEYDTLFGESIYPEGDSTVVESIASEYTTEALKEKQDQNKNGNKKKTVETPENVNVVVIVNESLADLSDIGALDTNRDPIPFLHRCKGRKDTRVGRIMVSSYPGNICDTEYEFLTGQSLEYPFSYMPFLDVGKDNKHSLWKVLHEQGYRIIATCPEPGDVWNRRETYQTMGADEFLDLESYSDSETAKQKGISDKAIYDKVYEELSDSESIGSKKCIYAVTTRKNSLYDLGNYVYSNDKLLVMEKTLENEGINQYLSLLLESDRALESFVSKVDTLADPTLVILLGSGFPCLDDSTYVSLNDAGDAMYTIYQKYRPMYMLHSNYNLSLKSVPKLTSVQYMGAHILDLAGLRKTVFDNYLLDMEKSVTHAFNRIGYMNEEGYWLPYSPNTNQGSIWNHIQEYNQLITNLNSDEPNQTLTTLQPLME